MKIIPIEIKWQFKSKQLAKQTNKNESSRQTTVKSEISKQGKLITRKGLGMGRASEFFRKQ